MSFLQPWVLFALPLAFLPVVIHLLNRMRHRPMDWGGMMFLISATRESTRHAELRQWLILACRCLALLGLILALSRPLGGGWWNSGKPDTVILMLDRSASMEATAENQTASRRENALESFQAAAAPFKGSTRFLLLDSTARSPLELADLDFLTKLEQSRATDTAADIPAMFRAAAEWIRRGGPGSVELWLATDLQRSNFRPESELWTTAMTELASLPQGVRVRLLALDGPPAPDRSVEFSEVTRRDLNGKSSLELALKISSQGVGSTEVPLTFNLGGSSRQVDVEVTGSSLLHRMSESLPDQAEGGWGFVQLPSDGNSRNNFSGVVFSKSQQLEAGVFVSEEKDHRLLLLAAAPLPEKIPQKSRILTTENLTALEGSTLALLIWQAPLPKGAIQESLTGYVTAGGQILFLPPGAEDAGAVAGLGWGEVLANEENPASAGTWNEVEGPLAKTQQGLNLPVDDLRFLRWQKINGEGEVLARLGREEGLIVRKTLGRGAIYFCATRPSRDWSNLGQGSVLVPMLQRLMQEGGKRLQGNLNIRCGEPLPGGPMREWISLDAPAKKNPKVDSGIYRSGDLLVAVNRPTLEDETDTLEISAAVKAFGELPIQVFDQEKSGGVARQSEWWKIFLFFMALFLVVEGWLALPVRGKEAGREERSSAKEKEPVAG